MKKSNDLGKMEVKSWQFLFSILAGIAAGLLILFLVKPFYWGLLVGLLLATYLSGAASPREGALVGLIVLPPLGIYFMIEASLQLNMQSKMEQLPYILLWCLMVVLLFVLGAVFGLLSGKLFQLLREKKIVV